MRKAIRGRGKTVRTSRYAGATLNAQSHPTKRETVSNSGSLATHDFEGDGKMMKVFLAVGVAATTLTAFPAEARHITGDVTCAHWRHGTCMAWRPRYNVGYVFGPSY